MTSHGDSRHLHIIVHQISASDLVLCTPAAACAKPLFSHYAEVTDLLLAKLSGSAESTVSLLTASPDAPLSTAINGPTIAIGMQFSSPLSIPRASVVLRDESQPTATAVAVTGLLFPVVSALIPTWVSEVDSRSRARHIADGGALPRRILYLISGPSAQAGPENEAVGSSDGIALLLTRFMR